MAFDTTYRKAGDIRPPLEATITRPEESGDVDLTNADSVTLFATAPDGTLEIDNAAATIETAADGTVSYAVGSNELDAEGEYTIEWKVYWSGDDTDSERFPKKNYQNTHVSAELS
jgi:hypothetical protein